MRILRDCCGALSDLVETKVPVQPPPPAAAAEGPGPLDEGKPPLAKKEEVEEKEDTGGAEKRAVKLEEKCPSQKDKRSDKSRKRKEKEEEPGLEETPDKKPEGKRKKTKEEQLGGDRNPGGLSSGSRPSPAREEAQDLQTRVDTFASNNPKSFELGTLPVRGSVGRHFAEAETERRGAARPPEPAHPPRGHHDGHHRAQPGSGKKEKKSKGATHRARGREWRRRHPK